MCTDRIPEQPGGLDGSVPAQPEVTFAPLPDGEVVRSHRDTDGRLHVVIDTAQALLTAAEPTYPGACPIYPSWCMYTGDHDDHESDAVAANPDKPDDLDSVIMRNYEMPKPSIVVGNADLDAAQARAFAAWLEAAADQLDAAATLTNDREQ